MRSVFIATIAFILVSSAAMAGAVFSVGSVVVSEAKIAASIGAARTGAGYFRVMNHSSEGDRLISVAADFPRVEIHNIEEVDGQAMMVHQEDGLVIAAGDELQLAPGGLHVMFMGLSTPFVAGEAIGAVLTFEKAGNVEIVFDVVDRGEIASKEKSMDHSHDDH